MGTQTSSIPAFQYSKCRSGFTLIEIVLVVVIIAIGLSIAGVRATSGLDSTRIKTAMRTTVRTARYARSMAILKQEDCILTIATNRVKLVCGDDVLSDELLPENVSVSDFENLSGEGSIERTVTYYANGMNDGFELTIEIDDDYRHTIACHPITGEVTLDDD